MKKTWLSLGLLWVSLHAQTYTLDELVTSAFKNSPDINISSIDVALSKERYDQAFSGYLPKLDLQAAALHKNTLDAPLGLNGEDTVLSGSLVFSQLLYDFGKTSSLVLHAKKSTQSSNAALTESMLQKRLEVQTKYYGILRYKELIVVNKENIKLNESQLHRAKRYYETGIRTKVDISDAEVRLIKAQIALKNAEFNLQKAFAALDRAVGFTHIGMHYDVEVQKLDSSYKVYETLPPYPYELEKAIEYAYTHRPKLKKFAYAKEAAKALVKNAKAAYFPALSLNGEYTKSDAKKYNFIYDQEKWEAGLTLKWNLYGGGRDRAKIAENRLQTNKRNAQLTRTMLEIKEETTNTYIALQKSKEDVKLSQNLLKFAKLKFEQVSKQYEHGLSDYIELQEARQSYIDAKSALVVNYYNYYAAIAALDAAIGR